MNDHINLHGHEQFKTVALIPGRGGSRSIPKKNIRDFAGKPLLYWVLLAANRCKRIDWVFVATDDVEIEETVLGFGFEKTSIFHRSKESATDTAESEIVLLEFSRKVLFETMVFLQATNPFTTDHHIRNALYEFEKGRVDSMLSVVTCRRFLWTSGSSGAEPTNYDYRNRPRRQDFESSFLENGAFYINSRQNLLKYENRLCGRIGMYVMPEYSSVEIDETYDWVIAEELFSHRHQLQ